MLSYRLKPRSHSSFWIGGWVEGRCLPDVLEDRKSFPCRDTPIPRPPVCGPVKVLTELYRQFSAVPYVRRLGDSSAPQRPVWIRLDFSLSASVFLRLIIPPMFHIHSSSGAWATCPLEAAVTESFSRTPGKRICGIFAGLRLSIPLLEIKRSSLTLYENK